MPLKRADRNFAELLPELRVAQTGVQILFAFLLGLAFTDRFAKLGTTERDIYIATLAASALTGALLASIPGQIIELRFPGSWKLTGIVLPSGYRPRPLPGYVS